MRGWSSGDRSASGEYGSVAGDVPLLRMRLLRSREYSAHEDSPFLGIVSFLASLMKKTQVNCTVDYMEKKEIT